jgi:serine protease AprX
MSDNIVINGKSVAKSALAPDASHSNYILIQTTGEPLNKVQKTQLKDLGVNIQEFVGDDDSQLYLCGYKPESLEVLRQLPFVDYANVYQNDFVVPAEIQPAAEQTAAADQTNILKVDVLLHHDVNEPSDDLVNKIASAAQVEASAISVQQGLVRLEVAPKDLASIAAVDEVRVIHPVKERKLFNNVARGILNANNVKINNTTYRGNGQIVAVADTGLDKGSDTDVHDAFTGRVHKLFAWGRPGSPGKTDDPDGHGTHVCGSVLGSGNANGEGLVEGTAPAAKLLMQSVLDGGGDLGGIPNDFSELFDQAYQAGARVHTNSWGTPLPRSGVQNPYDTGAEQIDKFVWNNQDMTILFAAGNDGQDRDRNRVVDGKVNERSLGAEAAAKNCITVGASENNRPNLRSDNAGRPYTYGGFWPDDFPKNPLKDDNMANNPEGLAAFSSRGQSAEKRLKPDVVGPGTAILSTRSRNMVSTSEVGAFGAVSDPRYWYLAGTSMATPLIAGCCAVLRETLLANGYQDTTNGVKNPTGSLVKALLINGAIPIKGQYMPKEVGEEPNPHSGFGRVNLAGSVVAPGDKFCGYGTGVMDDDQAPFSISIPVPEGTPTPHQKPLGGTAGLSLKVTLVYADFSGKRLSNDLNLAVVAGNKERHGNQGNQDFSVGSTQPFDRANNVEQVLWPSVPGREVKIVVKAFRLTQDKVPFAYAWKFF